MEREPSSMRTWEGNQGSIIEKPWKKPEEAQEGRAALHQTAFERFGYRFIMSQHCPQNCGKHPLFYEQPGEAFPPSSPGLVRGLKDTQRAPAEPINNSREVKTEPG